MQDAYKDNLAHIHDAGFGELAKSAASLLVESLKRSGINEGRFVDIGCGSGITCQLLRNAGYSVIGIDISKHFLEIARNRNPDGEFYQKSYSSFDIPPCSAVPAIGEVLNYTFDEEQNVDPWEFFRCVYEALEPGGCFLFDVAGPERAPSSGSQKTFTSNDDWAVLMETKVDASNKILTRYITSFRRKDKVYKRDVEVHKLQLLDVTEIKQALQHIGFSIQVLDSYSNNLLPQGLIGILALKKK